MKVLRFKFLKMIIVKFFQIFNFIISKRDKEKFKFYHSIVKSMDLAKLCSKFERIEIEGKKCFC